jgi:hypothetical protein
MADSDKHQDEDGKDRFEISELFMAKCGANGWDRCFFGTISREKDANGKETACSSNICIPDDGCIWSRAEDQWTLGDQLDSLVELRLDYDIHADKGVFTSIAETRFFHN